MATTEHQQRLLDQQPLRRDENFYEKVALSEKVAARISARGRCDCDADFGCEPHQRVTDIVIRYLRYCAAHSNDSPEQGSAREVGGGALGKDSPSNRDAASTPGTETGRKDAGKTTATMERD